MQAIRDFICFFFFFDLSLLSLTVHPHLLLADTITVENPRTIIANETDYHALLAFKAEISDDPSNLVLSSWNKSFHFCRWEGVTCGRKHNRVIRLDLSSSKLVGTLSPFIGNLSFLHQLNLTNNSFRGDIPHQISRLPRLRILALARNYFKGEIPANLSRCLHLTQLDLGRNMLVGRIPSELASLPNMIYFGLDNNNLRGRLQDIGIGNMSTSLQTLSLYQNLLQGSIPDGIGRLKYLDFLSLGYNMISGPIPASLFNLSRLRVLYLSNNKIHGRLPQDLGVRLPQLRLLSTFDISLIGQVPTSLSNLSELHILDISYNNFTGPFSLDGNKLPHLSYLNIEFAYSFGGGRDLSFLDTLTNCTNLMTLFLGGNSFFGSFPYSILNLSTSLNWLALQSNQISGQLPPGLGKFVNLYGLNLENNHFKGLISGDIGKMESMELMYLGYNNFLGEIPPSLGNLTLLTRLSMIYNNLQGSLPKIFGNCQNLQMLRVHHNKLSGVVPVELFHASGLIGLDIGQNNLHGSLPVEISRLKNLAELDASQNRFSGEIPSTLGVCTSLTFLDMSKNSFVGSIPEPLSPLKSINTLDLSYNNLSGQIPSYFLSWPYLSRLNLSFNNLEGEVPINGIFANTSVVSIVGNNKLCGGVFGLHLRRCPSPKESKRRRLSLALIMTISISCVLIVVLSVALSFYLLHSQRKRKDASSRLQNIKPSFLEVSYQMLLRATNGFSPSNLIGVGGFGTVYKGILHQDDTELLVAVKVMNPQREGAGKSFLAECKALRNIRHRNLVKIITACSSIDTQRNDFKALIYEFMPRGSLEEWLYSNHVTKEHVGDNKSCSLSLFQRLNIAIDVACALEYLHIGCESPITHCDLKPTNILLDDEMTAHIGDFGLVKFLPGALTSGTTNQTSSTQVRGTVGYAAPEYGLGSKVSPEGDIYSFGIIVLEMMTAKKPTDPMFTDGLTLHDYSNSALPHRVMEIIDQIMLGDASILQTDGDMRKIECINSVMMVGVQCSMALLQERMSISNALNELKSARQKILSDGP